MFTKHHILQYLSPRLRPRLLAQSGRRLFGFFFLSWRSIVARPVVAASAVAPAATKLVFSWSKARLVQKSFVLPSCRVGLTTYRACWILLRSQGKKERGGGPLRRLTEPGNRQHGQM